MGADATGEPEITDRAADDLEERVVEELSLRTETVGSAYPFELVSSAQGFSQTLHLKSTWKDLASGQLIYIFCLLDSGIRDHLISVPSVERSVVDRIGTLFQICSCIAVGGYTQAEVVSFGFPRATGTAFLPALRETWQRYGSYAVRQSIPYGFDDKLKDGGVDIIAWRHFSDGHAATFLMFVQVASGLKWKDKPVASDVSTIRQWFFGERFDHFLPAICIPFPLWFDLGEPAKDLSGNPQSYREGVLTRFAYRESKFGIIFDRGRIATSCALALDQTGSSRPIIDGIERVTEIADWVGEVLDMLAPPREVA